MKDQNYDFVKIQTSTSITVTTQKGNTFHVKENTETFLPVNKTLQSTVSLQRNKAIQPFTVVTEHKIL